MHDAAYKHTCINSVHMHSCPRRCCGSHHSGCMHDTAYKHTCLRSCTYVQLSSHGCGENHSGHARHSIQTHVHQELCLCTAVLSTAATHSLLCSTGSGARAFAAVFLCTTVSTVKARLWFSTAVMHDSRLLWLCSTGSCACAQLSRAWLGLKAVVFTAG